VCDLLTASARRGGRMASRGELGEISRGCGAADSSLDRRGTSQGVPTFIRSHQSRQIIIDR